MLVLRPEGQAGDLAAGLTALGAVAVVVPAIRILPPRSWGEIDGVLGRLDEFDWIVFTSVNGVRNFMGRVLELGLSAGDLPPSVAAIGPATREALEQAGATVEWVPGSYTTASMAEEFPMSYEPGGRSVCLVRADVASGELEDVLTARGFNVERINAYRTEPAGGAELLTAAADIDAVALTSASITASFADAAGRLLRPGTLVFSIGPATTRSCEEHGLVVSLESKEHTVPGLLRAMAAFEWPPRPLVV